MLVVTIIIVLFAVQGETYRDSIEANHMITESSDYDMGIDLFFFV